RGLAGDLAPADAVVRLAGARIEAAFGDALPGRVAAAGLGVALVDPFAAAFGHGLHRLHRLAHGLDAFIHGRLAHVLAHRAADVLDVGFDDALLHLAADGLVVRLGDRLAHRLAAFTQVLLADLLGHLADAGAHLLFIHRLAHRLHAGTEALLRHLLADLLLAHLDVRFLHRLAAGVGLVRHHLLVDRLDVLLHLVLVRDAVARALDG